MQVSRIGAGSTPFVSAYSDTLYNPFNQFSRSANGVVNANHLSRSIAPIQFERWAADIEDWRNAMREMEQAFYPFRTKSTRIYIDSWENVFVKAMIEKMQELVLQREPTIYQWKSDGLGGKKKKVISQDLTQSLNSQFWLKDYRTYIQDAIPWGFRSIELGDLCPNEENIFPELTYTRPENIRIDTWRGALLTSVPYYIDGIEIQSDDDQIKMWNHYIPTKSNRGVSPCGYGMLYNISEYAIHLKHLLGWRMDFIENYGQPTRVGTTSKQGKARKAFENFLSNPTSNQYVLLDRGSTDEFRLEQSAAGGTGTGWKNHGDAAVFLKRELSQMGLGHEDAMMTTPGKVGANVTSNKDGFNESSLEQAINQKQDKYSDFEINKFNTISAPAFRKLSKFSGINWLDFVPKGYCYGLTNDKEEQETKRRFNSDWKAKMECVQVGYNGGVRLKNLEDLNAMIPEFPNGFEYFEPAKELDEKRTSETTITKTADSK